MVDILLIQPPIRDFYLTAKRTIPYGLACIASSLIKNGFTVKIFDGLASAKSRIIDLPQEITYIREFYKEIDVSAFGLFYHYKHFGYSFDHIGKITRESNAFLVGISSLFTAYSFEALKTAEIVKKYNPQCKIVLGGHHPTSVPESVIENIAVDFVIRGEGEVSMVELAHTVKAKEWLDEKKLISIPGIVFAKNNSTLHINKPAMMDKPDNFPLPATNLIKQKFYRRNKRGSAVIVASRGCPMKCSYCCVGSSSLSYRQRSVESVLKEIEHEVKHNETGFIDFEDENLSLNKRWFLKLLQELETRYGKGRFELRAMNGLFPPSLDEELIIKMKNVGFKTLNLSLGSTSKSQLEKFSRPDIRESFENILNLAKKHKLECVCYIIVGAPRQLAEDSLSDILYLSTKKVLTGISVYYPAPGSSDYELCSKLNILPSFFSLMRSSTIPISHTTTRLESVTLMRLGRIQNFIKRLEDNGHRIPSPSHFKNTGILDSKDRLRSGQQLLSWFFYDGILRGITPEGNIFEHKTAHWLTKRYINNLKY